MTASNDGGRGHPLARAASIALLLLGVVALVWALSTQQGSPPSPDASDGLSQAPKNSSQVTDKAAQTAAPDMTSSTQAHTEASSRTKRPEAVKAEEPQIETMTRSTPVSVDIPSIGVNSDLHPLGLNQDGTLQVPAGQLYNQAAWYDGSPTPGELGPSVIEGHVTSQGSVPSVFFDLGELSHGDTVDVTREDGSVATFEVYATDSFPKNDFPKVAVYGNTEVPELRLITCGGDYDSQARAHLDNIVVFAKLLPAT